MITTLRSGVSADDGGTLRRAHRQHESTYTFTDAPVVTGPPAWTLLSACAGLTPQEADRLFFPGRAGSPPEAKQMCDDCPVQSDCLEAGRFEMEGMWGGRTPAERFELFGRPTNLAYCGSGQAT